MSLKVHPKLVYVLYWLLTTGILVYWCTVSTGTYYTAGYWCTGVYGTGVLECIELLVYKYSEYSTVLTN
jgi:hypothetical protein